MAEGQSRSPQAPTTRPAWLLLLSFVMMMSASQLGMAGLDTLAAPVQEPPRQSVVMNFDDVRVRVQEMAGVVARREHPTAVVVHAVGRIVVAGFLLFAVATVFARDPRGRAVAIGAGWLGIVHEITDALFAVIVSRQALLEIRLKFLDELTTYTGKRSPDMEPANFFAALEASTLVVPLVGAAFGILLSSLIVIFFKGRRGRILYGLEPASGART